MTEWKNTTLSDELEAMIDAVGVSEVLKTIADVCDAKAEHILTNWQDQSTSQWWLNRSIIVGELACKPFMQDA